MALKTQPTDNSVQHFINEIGDDQKRRDCEVLLPLMEKLTGAKPKMWGDSIVGFGEYHYRYDSGREGDWFLTGFSPRKQNLTIYLMAGLEALEDVLSQLGKYKHGKGCLYVKTLADIDMAVLEKVIAASVKMTQKRYKDVNP